ncbi:MAG: UDP-3-O-(3-hydroxymyristoyl)glucosamine N-acyltransferase, partial [Gammaproteobacteria bacterium]|nr:UDP-3-O-(3-hydroxymyristoyl)glucosamine N-acyltransferase [Gammaproteobacteria bacterium]
SVIVGDNVEIGAGTTIDRGALNHTTIGSGCKLDNQVQVGHGTSIDHHTVISGCTAIAGSTRIGSYCLIGGAVGIVDNIEIGDRVEITAMTLVSRSILEQGRYSSGTGLMPGYEWKRSVVGFRKLDNILKRLRRLEADQ